MRTRNYTPASGDWKRRSTAPLFAVMALLLSVLSSTSCRSVRQVRSARTLDSTLIHEKLLISPVTIPMSRASLAIAIEDLRRLSDGAIYTAHSGQAGVTAEKRGNDTILITATCDSLQELVYSYERELKSLYQSETVVQKETKPPPSPFKWFAYGLITGVIATITVIIILKLKRKWQKQDQ